MESSLTAAVGHQAFTPKTAVGLGRELTVTAQNRKVAKTALRTGNSLRDRFNAERFGLTY